MTRSINGTEQQNSERTGAGAHGIITERFYIDCEFDGHNGPLLSIALVPECGSSVHIRTDQDASDPWVRQNVVPLMDSHHATLGQWIPLNEVGNSIRSVIGKCESPVIIADSPVDIGRFCQALSTGPDGGWASADYPQMRFEVHNVDCYPTELPDAVQHNAWWDAMALRHKFRDTAFCPSCGGEFDGAEWRSSSRCPECEEPKEVF